MDSWLVFRRNRAIINQWTKRNDWSFKRFSKTPFVWSFPIRQEILNVSQKGVTFHRICPPIFIQTWLQQYSRGTFFHSAHCSQQSHLFPICVVSTYNDSRKDLHKLCQIPTNCRCKWLQASYLAPWTFASSFVFPEKFLFCTDTTGSIGWPMRTLWSAVIKSQNFLHEVRFRQCAFCTGPFVILVLWQISQFRSLRKWV